MIARVTKINSDIIEFDNGSQLYSHHEQDCCEHHYLSFGDITMSDFDGLEFDLSSDNFFRRIEDYGIELVPVRGHSVKIPGYGSNNGYYSSDLSLVLTNQVNSAGKNYNKSFDISTCQDISG